MADILIRGMEMPKYTTKAEFGIDADGNPLCMVCHEDGTEPDIYDVVPLPAGHGRLIDAEAYVDYMQNRYDNNEITNGDWIDFRLSLKDQPTIVPAEGGGES